MSCAFLLLIYVVSLVLYCNIFYDNLEEEGELNVDRLVNVNLLQCLFAKLEK